MATNSCPENIADGRRLPAGTRVRIRMRILEPEDRAPGLPGDTQTVPYEATIRGLLEHDASVGDIASIRTPAGRRITGTVDLADPVDAHTFGRPVQPFVDMVAGISALREELETASASRR